MGSFFFNLSLPLRDLALLQPHTLLLISPVAVFIVLAFSWIWKPLYLWLNVICMLFDTLFWFIVKRQWKNRIGVTWREKGNEDEWASREKWELMCERARLYEHIVSVVNLQLR